MLLAAVIGPVVAPRYRFVMVPFFAILAAQAPAGGRASAATNKGDRP